MNRDTTIQLRHLFGIASGSTPESGNADYWDGDIAWVTPEDVSQVDGNVLRDTRRKLTAEGFANSGTTMACAGGIVLTKRAPIGQLALLGLDACSNQGCFLLSAREGIEPRFFYYVLANSVPLLQALGRGSTFMELSTDDLKALRVPVLAYDQQARIANYLDASVAKIDELLQSKRGLLEILAEKRKAIIATAVTRGLDPKVKLRDSGVPWLGEIPAHWEVVPFRWYFRIGSGDFIATDEVVFEPDAARGTPVIGGNGVAGYTAAANTSDAASIVVGRVGAQCGNVHVITGLAWVTDNALLLRDIREYEVEYLAQVLRHRDLNSIANKTAQPLITGSMVTELRGPRPPLDEQRAIVAHIARETAKLDAVRAATERTIALLKERRSALIAAAVTGQLDVTMKDGAAA